MAGREPQVLVLRPESHLLTFLASDAAHAGCRIAFQPIMLDGMAEDCGQLVVDDFKVCGRIGAFLFVAIG